MDIQQISTSSCETTYKVDGDIIRLYVITGGEPALSLGDFSFSQRYPCKDQRWAIGHDTWNIRQCYPHQDSNNLQGPTLDILPEGEKTLAKYLTEVLPAWRLRDKRVHSLPVSTKIVSRRCHDKASSEYFHLEASFGPCFITRVFHTSSIASCRMTQADRSIVHPWWVKYNDYIISVVSNGWITLERLTEEQFSQLRSLLVEGLACKAIRTK